jgi:hypothetical protein
MNDELEREPGESRVSFSAAADDAAYRLGERLGDANVEGTWRVIEWEVVLGHHSPSHIEVYKVTLQKGSG